MTPARASFILATAGHVDHGKSALVRALTGAEPDRLPEEKARGVTIELGFAHLALGEFDVGVIDVPGHEDFVKNMVAGVGAIDAALLVVAADDGWMPQTEEHLQILAYLGVQRAVIALTKIDLARDVDEVEAAIRARLVASPFAGAAIVRTSTKRGDGLDALAAAIRAMLAVATPRLDAGKPRLAVDRAFSLRGVGTVITGTLIGGSIGRGDSIVVQPSGTAAHVRLAQTHGRAVERAMPGSRVALNLPELKTDAGGVHRGDVVSRVGVGEVTACVDVAIERSPRDADAPPLTSGLRVVVHHGATMAFATLRTFDRAPIARGGRALARLELERPLLLLVGDRLLLRDSSQRATLAGAIVLDASPSRRRKGAADRQRTLLAARWADLSIAATIASQVARDRVVEIDVLDRSLEASRDALIVATEAGESRGDWRRAGGRIVAVDAWDAACAAVAAAVDAHHSAHPEHAGASLTFVRRAANAAGADAIFDAVVDVLCAGDFERIGTMLRRRGHRAALPPRLHAAGEAIRRVLDARPFDPPSRKETTRDDLAIQALRFLIASGAIVEIGPDVVMSDDAYRAAAYRVRSHLRGGRCATVSELKQLLGSSRRVVVPLLERFDRDGITRRAGDRRELGPRGDA